MYFVDVHSIQDVVLAAKHFEFDGRGVCLYASVVMPSSRIYHLLLYAVRHTLLTFTVFRTWFWQQNTWNLAGVELVSMTALHRNIGTVVKWHSAVSTSGPKVRVVASDKALTCRLEPSDFSESWRFWITTTIFVCIEKVCKSSQTMNLFLFCPLQLS